MMVSLSSLVLVICVFCFFFSWSVYILPDNYKHANFSCEKELTLCMYKVSGYKSVWLCGYLATFLFYFAFIVCWCPYSRSFLFSFLF